MDLYAFLLGVLCIQWTGFVGPAATLSVQGPGCKPGGGVDLALRSSEQQMAQELQFELSCNVNATARELWIEDLRDQFGVTGSDYYALIPTFYDHDETCRSASRCPGGEVTWCITVYHTTEHIQICLDKDGIINQTAYAQLLQLQCFFSVPRELECADNSEKCLRISQPEHMFDRSILTCSIRNEQENCISTSATLLNVKVTGNEMEEPHTVFENKTELILGETNLLLCTVFFTQGRFHNFLSAKWSIDGVVLEKIHEDPYCFLQEDCNFDTLATTRGNRVRAYEQQHGEARCPTPVLYYREWLWIDNATLEDTNHTYTCSGSTIFFNPFQRPVVGSMDVTFTPVFPLVPVNILEVPYVQNASSLESVSPLSLTFLEGEGFQWTCAVTAGVEDHLVWLFEGEPILPSALPEHFECPSNGSSSLYAVYRSADILSQFDRGYNTTLIGCNLSPADIGLYQCLLNRTRAEPLSVWSATVFVPLPTEETVESTGLSVSTELYYGIAAGISLLLVFALLLIVLCTLKYRKNKKRSQNIATINPAFASTEVTSFAELGRGFEKKREVSGKLPMPSLTDLLEFPRDKLEKTGIILGEGSFGRVLQAKAEGIVKGLPDRNIVAVKTCRENAPHHELNELWEELKLMKQMKPHKNIVNLLGHCTSQSGPLYLIIEFAIHGSLKDYLHQCKDVISKLNHAPHIAGSRRKTRHSSSVSNCPTLQEKIPLSQQSSVFSDISLISRANLTSSPTSSNPPSSVCLELGSRSRCLTLDSGFCGESVRGESHLFPLDATHDYINCKGLLYMEDVMNFALQIACGLQHLGDLEIAHCDLAARNVLIAEGFVLKIGDFGMARDISDKQYYRKHGDGRIPVKWSAPEVLENQIFTHQSDIWSYGVLLWEIFTYGQRPYPNQNISYSWDSFINHLKAGNRLPQPDGCPTPIYDLMLSCWQLSPDHRPTATELTQLLSTHQEVTSLASSDSASEQAATPTTSQKYSQESPDAPIEKIKFEI